MPNKIYTNYGIVTILSGEPSLRDSKHYQKVRGEINGRMAFLSGATRWELVFNECITLGTKVGMDFLLTSYFSVAGFKVEGVKGLALGLELMLAAYLEDKDHKEISSHHKQEIIQWMVSKVTRELRLTKSNREQLRDLYRCERGLHVLNELCECFQPESSPNLESVAFSIFEHIDNIETTVTQESQKIDVLSGGIDRKGRSLSFCLIVWGLTMAVGCYFAVEYMKIYHADENARYTTEVTKIEELLPSLTAESVSELPSSEQAELHSYIIDKINQGSNSSIYQQEVNLITLIEKAKLFPNQLVVEAIEMEIEARNQIYREGLQRDLKRFLSARTLAANVVSNHKFSTNKKNIENLEQYILSLSPIYSRYAFVQELIEKQKYELAKEELAILQERVARIVWQLSTYQKILSENHSDVVNTGLSENERTREKVPIRP